MELIKLQIKKGFFSQVLKFLFDAVYVMAVFSSVIFLGQPWVAVALVLVSKWRIFFVRPRFWWVNILSNLTDVIFGLSIVVLMCVSTLMWQQILLAVAFLAWTVFLKPKSKRNYIIAQGLIGQFFGIWALFALAHFIWLPFVILINFVIGFASARHILTDYEEDSRTLLSLLWGVIIAEMGFLAFHWVFSYYIFNMIPIPQIAILDVLLGVIAFSVYNSYSKNEGSVKWDDIRWPVVFSTLLILTLSIIFSGLLQ